MNSPSSTLAMQEGDTVTSHRAFLLWLMQTPTKRNLRATARALDVSDTAVRKWVVRYEWAKREASIGVGADTLAIRAYGNLYHRLLQGREVAFIQECMALQYVGPGQEVLPWQPTPKPLPALPTPKPGPMLNQMDSDAFHTLEAENGIRRKRVKQLDTILDGATARIAQKITGDKLKYSLNDLLTITRLRRELEMDAGLQVANGPVTAASSSVRVDAAVHEGGDVLAALREDHAELGMIIGVLQTATNVSNVLPFPGGRAVRESTG